MTDQPLTHDWAPSRLGHGEAMCRRCFITNREAAALGVLNECDPPATTEEKAPMPQISEVKIEIGRDAHGRRVTATRHHNNGKPMWRLEAEPMGQRDEGERMWSLTDDNLRELAKAPDLIKSASR